MLFSLNDVGIKTLLFLTDDLSLMQLPMCSLVIFLHIDNLIQVTISVQRGVSKTDISKDGRTLWRTKAGMFRFVWQKHTSCLRLRTG